MVGASTNRSGLGPMQFEEVAFNEAIVSSAAG